MKNEYFGLILSYYSAQIDRDECVVVTAWRDYKATVYVTSAYFMILKLKGLWQR